MEWAPHFILWFALFLPAITALGRTQFQPGEIWLDTGGKPIQAHGGGILVYRNVYYWYGEDRTPRGPGAVACYSSTNLLDWKSEGVVLSPASLPMVAGRRTFVERPKVIYNRRTGKFVMWMHLEQEHYLFSRAGIAVSDGPVGPFAFLKAIRPVVSTNDFVSLSSDPAREKDFGGTFRDMNLFLDDDGQAYVFYSSEDNWTMYVVRLDADFTGPQTPVAENKTWARILVRQMREGPAPFKWSGRYFLITSACTGWAPNTANYSTASNLLGPWRTPGNPCVGINASTTFGSQSTFVLPAPGWPGGFIFMADRWNPHDLSDSRYVWLPFTVKPGGTFTIPWRDHWEFSVYKSPD